MRLLVIGDCLLDRDIIGRVERLCPDAPVPVVDVESVDERPGGAGLAAILAAQSPAAQVTLATGLSDDDDGGRLQLRLVEWGIRVVPLLSVPHTITKTRVRSAGRSLLRLDDSGRLCGRAPGRGDGPSAESAGDVDDAALAALVRRHDAVLVADYGGPVTSHRSVRRVLQRSAAAVPVVWDPHPRGLAPVPGTVVATPNRSEAERVVGVRGRPATELARSLRSLWPVEVAVVTDGSAGAGVADRTGCRQVPAAPCPDDVDPCGAGDRFAAEVAIQVGEGRRVRQAVDSAVQQVSGWLAAGGVSTIGRAPRPAPDPGSMAARPGPSAEEEVERVRRAGGVVVATGGCFDVLHAGHLETLERARALGDCLVVLLNSDAGVRRLKGSGRPVHSAADRMRLLEALRCVDAVEVFEDDDPSDALARLRPDIWVKGGDYRVAELPERPVVEAYGGRVQILPTLTGRSTTLALEQLSRSNGRAM